MLAERQALQEQLRRTPEQIPRVRWKRRLAPGGRRSATTCGHVPRDTTLGGVDIPGPKPRSLPALGVAPTGDAAEFERPDEVDLAPAGAPTACWRSGAAFTTAVGAPLARIEGPYPAHRAARAHQQHHPRRPASAPVGPRGLMVRPPRAASRAPLPPLTPLRAALATGGGGRRRRRPDECESGSLLTASLFTFISWLEPLGSGRRRGAASGGQGSPPPLDLTSGRGDILK